MLVGRGMCNKEDEKVVKRMEKKTQKNKIEGKKI